MEIGGTPRTRKRLRAFGVALALVASGLVLTGCGTKVVSNDVLVAVDRSTGGVGPGPVEVAVFDTTMGSSSEYGAQWIGTTTESEPYRGEVKTTVTRLVGYGSPPERLDLGLVVTALGAKGYFAVSITPETGASGEISAPFVPDFAFDEAVDGPVGPLHLSITREPVGDAWRISIVARP